MYYRYEIVGDNIYKLSEKSNTLLDGERVVTADEDIDLQLFDVTVGYIYNGVMVRHTKKLKSTEAISQVLNDIKQEINPSIDIESCTIEMFKAWQIKQSKSNLDSYFINNTIISSCHQSAAKQYSITRDKQTLLTQMIMMTQIAYQANIPYQPSWNASGEPCTYDWTLEELQQLAFEIEQIVRPKVSHQQTLESQINACETKNEVYAIDITFE